MATPKFEGVKVMIGGAEYVVPPLNLRQIKQFQDTIGEQMKKASAASGDGLNLTELDSMKEVILAAMQRNYPELSAEWIDENIDMGNLISVFVAAMGVSGLKKAAAELGSPGG